MFKKVYVPIDNSEISNKILQEAIDLVKATRAELRISHVIDLRYITFGFEKVGVAELKDALISIGKTLIDQAKAFTDREGIIAEVKLIENHGSDTISLIADDAKEFAADLFILGSHHLNFSSPFVSGGIVDNLVYKTQIPILLINSSSVIIT